MLSGLCLVTHNLLYVLPVVLFIIPGKWLRIIILLCLVVWIYGMVKSGVLWLYLMTKSDEQGKMTAAVSSSYFRNLAETFSN